MADSEYMQFLKRNSEIIASWPAWKRELFNRVSPIPENAIPKENQPMLPGKITVELNAEELKAMLIETVKAKLRSEGVYCGAGMPLVEFEIREGNDVRSKAGELIVAGARITVQLGKKPPVDWGDK